MTPTESIDISVPKIRKISTNNFLLRNKLTNFYEMWCCESTNPTFSYLKKLVFYYVAVICTTTGRGAVQIRACFNRYDQFP